MSAGDDEDGQLAADISAAASRIRTAFLAAAAWVGAQHTEDDLARLVAMGHADEAAAEAGQIGARVAAEVNAAELEAAKETDAVIAEARGKLASLASHDPAVVERARRTEADLIDGFLAEQQTLIREVLFDAASRSLGNVAAAREIKASIGLTPTQAGYVDSYRALLERGSRAALDRELRDRRFDRTVEGVADGRLDLSPAKIDRMVERYRMKWLARRAQTLSHDLALRAVNGGRQLALEQAILRGDVASEDVTREWRHLAGQKHPRDFHVAMHGQLRAVDEPFVSGRGGILMYPGDPDAGAEETANCNCGLKIKIAALAGTKLRAEAA